MAAVYRIWCRYGKVEIEVESSSEAYVEKKLAQLLATLPDAKGGSDTAAAMAGVGKGRKSKSSKKSKASKAVKAKKSAKKAKASKPGKAAKKAKAKKAAKRASAPAKAQPAKRPPSKKAGKAASAAPADGGSGVSVAELARQLKGSETYADIDSNILKRAGQLPRVLLCFYAASQHPKKPALTAAEVEALTDKLGKRIAPTNVAKVIRQGGKRFLTAASKNGAVTAYKLNARGQQAVDQLIKGGAA